MARIQVYQGGNIQRDDPRVVPIRAPDFGPGIGQGLERLGEAGSQIAETLDRTQQLHDEASAKEAANKVAQWYTAAAYTGPNALFAKEGKDALDTAPFITKGIDSEIADARKTLKSPRQIHIFDQAMAAQRLDWQTQIGHHVITETKNYASGEASSRASLSGEMAGLSYLDDPQQGEAHIATMQDEIAELGKLRGWDSAKIIFKKLKATSGVYHDIGLQIARTGEQGPDLAREFVDKHSGSMTDEDRRSVISSAEVRQNVNEEKVRRQQEEARRQKAEEEKQARLRATSAAELLSSGLPMDPQTYANAMTDAKTAEDVALIKKLQDGQLKNSTLFAHQHDTPAQLQDQVNRLSADITKSGTKADPDNIVRRDALQQLLSNSTEQLKSDGIEWASRHLGMTPPPFNPADPNSVKDRVEFVQSASRRAGVNIDPLQPSEIRPFAQVWHSGDATQKTNLVMNLANFGPLSAAAAQSIAPNDNGLVHLIGLASQSNKGVAVSRVSQAMAGYEALKTEGQLVTKLASQPDFNTWTGSALQFMPGARDGVFTVAKALLAEDASQHGWADSSSADDKAWYRAINSALGAYNRGAVQFGGLAGFNGAQTVLPENMSLDDFEARVARANGNQIHTASNGTPVTANGTSLSPGALKKMHFIPVDDGVYRLELGGSFAHLANGQPFEIDIRKLPASR